MSTNIQIRHIGSYEIVFYDKNNRRIFELVSDSSLADTEDKANDLLEHYQYHSYTISKIIRNTKFNLHSVIN